MLRVFKTQKSELNKRSITNEKYVNKSKRLTKKRLRLLNLDKQESFSISRGKIASVVIFILIVLCFISNKSESVIHQLEVYDKVEDEDVLSMNAFKAKLKERADKPLIYVAAHGGGLKANIWTMKVINAIQKETEGEFFNQTVSLSGASGGMMGLSLYAVLDGKYTNKFDTIASRINSVAKENFASKDISMMFGADFFRKLYPLQKIGAHRDRSYYSMVTYRNILEGRISRTLDALSFKAYWKKNIFKNTRGYAPSLIINTAKTNGKRGVFYSIAYPENSTIFYNSDKLSHLHNGTIAYYEAVSSTNRFPALSPAAKIKGHGHYIDAGAIDNSGLLSALDLHNYLKKDSLLNATPKVFVEIINGRTNYIHHLVQEFKKEQHISNIFIEEIEQDNIIADLKTGLNLDKIPNYLSDFLNEWRKDPNIHYVPIYLPFQIQYEEIVKYLGADSLKNESQITALKEFLKIKNEAVAKVLDDDGFTWETYEPTLARHLSKSTITYYDRVLKSNVVTDEIRAIDSLFGN
ncbi:hypothetical protein MHTCC0001_34030 [Flavobacteriaceae bacterium MHTCC 0001]